MSILNFSKFKKDFFTLRNISKCGSDFWDRYSKVFFLLFSISIFSWGVYFWFQITYRSDWSSEQKKQYQNSQNKEIELKEQQFKKVIEEFERKKEIYSTSIQANKDIFASYLAEDQIEEENFQNEKPSSDSSASAENVSGNSVESLP
jgi:hypothetical protein